MIFLIDFYFLSSFRFIAKLSRKYRSPCLLGVNSLFHCQLSSPEWSFVMIDDPILTHGYHSKSIDYIWVAFGVVHSRVWQMCNDRCLPLQFHMEQFHCPGNPLCSASFPLPPFLFLAATGLFIISLVLPFPECHIVGIIKYIAPVHDFET